MFTFGVEAGILSLVLPAPVSAMRSTEVIPEGSSLRRPSNRVSMGDV